MAPRKTTPTKIEAAANLVSPPVPAATTQLSAGLAALDEDPTYYFLQFAENYFGSCEDVRQARENHETPERLAYLEYFSSMWQEMARAQAEKYQDVITRTKQGQRVLAKLNESLTLYRDIPAQE